MIVEHPKRRYDTPGTAGYGAPCLCVKCEFCGALSDTGTDIEEAVEAARNAGYSTLPGLNSLHPRKWACPTCKPKYTKKKN